MEKKISLLINNGMNSYRNAKEEDALNSLIEAVELARNEGLKDLMSEALKNIGDIYRNNGRMDESIKFYKRSLKINEEIGNLSNSAACLYNIGSILHTHGNYSEALEYYKKSIQIYEEIDASVKISDVQIKIDEIKTKI